MPVVCEELKNAWDHAVVDCTSTHKEQSKKRKKKKDNQSPTFTGARSFLPAEGI